MMAQRFGRSLRVAALQPSVSLTLDHLGCLDSLVACTRYCLQAVPSLRERDLKVIADSWSSNTEEILSASPDLVVASVPYRLESLAAILKCGVPVLTLAPHSLADVYQDIRLLGDILHVRDRAAAVVEEMMGAFSSTRDAVSMAETRAGLLRGVGKTAYSFANVGRRAGFRCGRTFFGEARFGDRCVPRSPPRIQMCSSLPGAAPETGFR